MYCDVYCQSYFKTRLDTTFGLVDLFGFSFPSPFASLTHYKYSIKYYIPENCYWHLRKKDISLFLRINPGVFSVLVRNIISHVGLFSILVMLTFAPPRSFHAYLLRFQDKALWLQYIEKNLAYKISRGGSSHFQARAKPAAHAKRKELHLTCLKNVLSHYPR